MTSLNTAQVAQPRCRGQPENGDHSPTCSTPCTEGNTMIRTIVTAIAAAALVVLGAGVATADVISQSTSEESHQKTTNTGNSNSAEDHMANDGPGIVEGDTPGHVWAVVKRIPRVDENGDPVIGSSGLQIIDLVWADVPIGSGVPQATIVHN